MPARRNLSPNPACANDAAGWFGPSGWARSTSVHASLPRTTGFVGTTTGDVACPRFDAVAGLAYVVSVSVRAVAVQTNVAADIDWYGSSGYLSTGNGPNFSPGANTTVRIDSGALTAPSGAIEGLLAVKGIDGSMEITAYQVEQAATLGTYFDGATTSPKANWDGTAGNSTSTLFTGDETVTLGEAASVVSTTPGPVGGDTVRLVEAASGTGVGSTVTELYVKDSGLIVSTTYDDVRGRIRVTAFGLPAATVRVVVSARPASSTVWTQVRGGRVAVTAGAMVRPADDYEFLAGVAMYYRIVALSSVEGAPDVVVATATATVTNALASCWLKFIAAPFLNRKIRLIDWGDISRRSRNAVFDVTGRSDPVVVTDVHSSRQVSITLETFTIAEAAALDAALRVGVPAFLQTPVTLPLPSLYAAIGDYTRVRPARRSLHERFTIQLTEVAPPPPSVVVAAVSWQTLLTQNTTWTGVLAAYPTWQGVVSA